MRWAYAMPVCVLFIPSRSGIVFQPDRRCNHWPQSINEGHRPVFNALLYVKDSGHRKPVLILSNWLNKPGERAHDRSLISAVSGIRTHNLLIDGTACCHWAIIASIFYHNQLVISIIRQKCYYCMATHDIRLISSSPGYHFTICATLQSNIHFVRPTTRFLWKKEIDK